jgi:hypothetical protein
MPLYVRETFDISDSYAVLLAEVSELGLGVGLVPQAAQHLTSQEK